MKNLKTLDNLFEAFSDRLTIASLNAISLLSQISATISIERIKRKMKQKEFAKFMNVSQGMVSRWEGGNYNFTIKQLCEICEKLDLTPSLDFKNNNAVEEYHPSNEDCFVFEPTIHIGQAPRKEPSNKVSNEVGWAA